MAPNHRRRVTRAGTADGEPRNGSKSTVAVSACPNRRDETLIALGLEAHLRGLGFQACDLAADGHQALSRAMNNPPNVVLMDVNLEGNREGIEVARRLREQCDIPIVFVTGCTDSETIGLLRSEVPGAPVLPKPVWGDRLTDAVENVMTFRMR